MKLYTETKPTKPIYTSVGGAVEHTDWIFSEA